MVFCSIEKLCTCGGESRQLFRDIRSDKYPIPEENECFPLRYYLVSNTGPGVCAL